VGLFFSIQGGRGSMIRWSFPQLPRIVPALFLKSLNVNSCLKFMTVLVRQSRGQAFTSGLSWFFTRFSGE
jgi:hypothetical protein